MHGDEKLQIHFVWSNGYMMYYWWRWIDCERLLLCNCSQSICLHWRVSQWAFTTLYHRLLTFISEKPHTLWNRSKGQKNVRNHTEPANPTVSMSPFVMNTWMGGTPSNTAANNPPVCTMMTKHTSDTTGLQCTYLNTSNEGKGKQRKGKSRMNRLRHELSTWVWIN